MRPHARQLVTVIVVGALFLGVYVPVRLHTRRTEIPPSFSADSARIADFLAHLDSVDTLSFAYDRDRRRSHVSLPPRERFRFDPNTVDSVGLLRLGFRPFMAHNLINYRNHGGRILNQRRFKSVFGIDTALIDSLRPFIVYPETAPDTMSRPRYRAKSCFAFDLNQADTALLAQLPGIGPGRARQIVGYRRNLGGYVSVEQLAEIEDFPDTIVAALRPFASASPDSVRKININRSSIKYLRRHPYVNYYQARAIYNLRWDQTHRGTLTPSDLQQIKEFTPEELLRLLPYIEF